MRANGLSDSRIGWIDRKMLLTSEESRIMRDFFISQFAPRFPWSFQALQRMAVSASKAYKNAGKKSWLGRDKGAESYAEFMSSVQVLGSYLESEGYLGQAGRSGDTWVDVCKVVRAFFVAYPNWQDAEATWSYLETMTSENKE